MGDIYIKNNILRKTVSVELNRQEADNVLVSEV